MPFVNLLAPFLRSYTETISEADGGGAPPVSRFYGVTRFDNDVNECAFAVECPHLQVMRASGIFTLPTSLNVRGGGEKIVLRAGLDEFVAGQLYVFIIRILYGKGAVDAIHEQCKSSRNHVEDVLLSFGTQPPYSSDVGLVELTPIL